MAKSTGTSGAVDRSEMPTLTPTLTLTLTPNPNQAHTLRAQMDVGVQALGLMVT